MLQSLRLQNFRGFRDHTVEFTQFCILMGQNNAGKTTIIEALRIIALAQAKAPQANFRSAPDWLAPELTGAVYEVSLGSIGFEHETVHHQYQKESPAIIIATLRNGCTVKVVIGPETGDVFCQLTERGGKKAISRRISSNPKFGQILVMPPVGQLLLHEVPITEDYMRKNAVGFRAHRHFRNQLYRNLSAFAIFREVAEESWQSLQIRDIELITSERGQEYRLPVRDGPFVSEVGQQGSGLQAWLQTLWFLTTTPKRATLVLDEPDVYLHADLQRKLLKILGSSGINQVVVATHSVEMISDVSFEEVVPVKKRGRYSRPLKNQEELQKASESVGSLHNLQLSKIADSGCILFVEGKDKAYLSEIAFKVRPAAYDRFVALPTFSIQGFNNWPRAALTAAAFHEASCGRIKSKIILDRDYKSDGELKRVLIESSKSDLEVIYWKRKEIENYFLVPAAIFRALKTEAESSVTLGDVEDLLKEAIAELLPDLEAQIAEAARSADRALSVPQALKAAREIIAERKKAGVSDCDFLSGKAVLSLLSEKLQAKFKLSLNPMAICRAMTKAECDGELVAMIDSIL
jgi:energy-coupling factor transporter ATP-binding protein EcfA2